jgi:ferrous iron transport protein B
MSLVEINPKPATLVPTSHAPSPPEAPPGAGVPGPTCFAMLGNPNTGKTTLYNRLCGLRAKTANFPGSTVEARIGHLSSGSTRLQIVDLPGLYGLHLDRPESKVCRDYLTGHVHLGRDPEALLIVLDATNLPRNLVFACQALQLGLPAVVALNMIDLAQRRGLTIDTKELGQYLGVPVVAVCARSGQGVNELVSALKSPHQIAVALPDAADTKACVAWANGVVEQSVGGDHALGASRAGDAMTDRLDAAFTHPILGLLVFAAIMTGLFYTIFTLATVPMDLIELLFAHVGGWVHSAFVWLDAQLGTHLVNGAIHNLMVDGVIGGVAGTVVFLPQICLLFFLISLLEDTGYLARASFVMDRIMRRFGLPGQAFVPMLSAHACALPAIMSARLIPDHRDRLATILVTPFLSCSARLPVYVLLISMLFVDRPLLAGVAFAGCYMLGAVAALLTALLFRRTILRGPARPMVLELPTYKLPSLRTALLTTYDRGMTFLRKAGTVILGICIVLWWLSAYPVTTESAEVAAMRQQAANVAASSADEAAALNSSANEMASRQQMTGSFAGRIGRVIEPAFAPLGYDWQLSIGVLTSFAAREVFVSTMSVLFAGTDDAEDPEVLDRIKNATRDNGKAVFTTATSASLLVFYVLAMQCLPTLTVTRRETGRWSWAILQLGWMTAVAYVGALIVHATLRAMGVP